MSATAARAARAAAATLAALVLLLGACGTDGPEEPEGVPTSASGTVVFQDPSTATDTWVHLVHGATGLKVSAAAAATDQDGLYTVEGFVPEERCHTVRLVVLDGPGYSAALTALADSSVGRCGQIEADLTVGDAVVLPSGG